MSYIFADNDRRKKVLKRFTIDDFLKMFDESANTDNKVKVDAEDNRSLNEEKDGLDEVFGIWHVRKDTSKE